MLMTNTHSLSMLADAVFYMETICTCMKEGWVLLLLRATCLVGVEAGFSTGLCHG